MRAERDDSSCESIQGGRPPIAGPGPARCGEPPRHTTTPPPQSPVLPPQRTAREGARDAESPLSSSCSDASDPSILCCELCSPVCRLASDALTLPPPFLCGRLRSGAPPRRACTDRWFARWMHMRGSIHAAACVIDRGMRCGVHSACLRCAQTAHCALIAARTSTHHRQRAN